MNCPECGGESKVLETRWDQANEWLKRRRLCLNPYCMTRWFTVEVDRDRIEGDELDQG